ncbi:MAG TPA: hypothetical protein ENK06_10070 [Gammaproteobacteria bacterium]|nr:hypothetical protein [Gammaproteobacteria bacterium]
MADQDNNTRPLTIEQVIRAEVRKTVSRKKYVHEMQLLAAFAAGIIVYGIIAHTSRCFPAAPH